MRRLTLLVLVLCLAALPSTALAQEDADDEGGLLMRFNGDVALPQGDSTQALIVLNGDADIAGEVREFLLVVNGDIRVSGTVSGEITIINGTLTLESTARVNNISLIESELQEEPGSVIAGETSTRSRWSGWFTGAVILFGFLFWVAMTIAVLVAGILFAAVGSRQLGEAGRLMGERVGPSILTGVITMIALPILAIIAIVTLIGIPLGVGVLLFLWPALAFLGYIVAGTWLGSLMLRRTPLGSRDHPYAPAILGLLVLQAVMLIPWFAPLVFLLGSIWGTGALVFMLFRNFRDRDGHEETGTPPPIGEPAS